jgi:hypothetical protein
VSKRAQKGLFSIREEESDDEMTKNGIFGAENDEKMGSQVELLLPGSFFYYKIVLFCYKIVLFCCKIVLFAENFCFFAMKLHFLDHKNRVFNMKNDVFC